MYDEPRFIRPYEDHMSPAAIWTCGKCGNAENASGGIIKMRCRKCNYWMEWSSVDRGTVGVKI